MSNNVDDSKITKNNFIQPSIGMYPTTSLGVSFYHHYKIDLLICRKDGVTANMFVQSPSITIDDGNQIKTIDISKQYTNGMLQALERKSLPGVIICTPIYEHLEDLVNELVDISVMLMDNNCFKPYHKLSNFYFPNIILGSNGIIYNETVNKLKAKLKITKIPEQMVNKISNKVVRASIMQGAYRENNVYYPHKKGLIKIALPKHELFKQIVQLLNNSKIVFSIHTNPNKVEFEKAMANIAINTIALAYALNKDEYKFESIDIQNALSPEDKVHFDTVREAQEAIFNIGKHVGAYTNSESFEKVWFPRMEQILKHDSTHVSSSFYNFREMIHNNRFPNNLPYTEQALIYPLKALAKQFYLQSEYTLFDKLEQMILENINFARNSSQKITTF